jgi:hypothetical protein
MPILEAHDYWGDFIQMWWPMAAIGAGVAFGGATFLVARSWKTVRLVLEAAHFDAEAKRLRESLEISEQQRKTYRSIILAIRQDLAHGMRRVEQLEKLLEEHTANERALYADARALEAWGVKMYHHLVDLRRHGVPVGDPPAAMPTLHGREPADETFAASDYDETVTEPV